MGTNLGQIPAAAAIAAAVAAAAAARNSSRRPGYGRSIVWILQVKHKLLTL